VVEFNGWSDETIFKHASLRAIGVHAGCEGINDGRPFIAGVEVLLDEDFQPPGSRSEPHNRFRVAPTDVTTYAEYEARGQQIPSAQEDALRAAVVDAPVMNDAAPSGVWFVLSKFMPSINCGTARGGGAWGCHTQSGGSNSGGLQRLEEVPAELGDGVDGALNGLGEEGDADARRRDQVEVDESQNGTGSASQVPVAAAPVASSVEVTTSSSTAHGHDRDGTFGRGSATHGSQLNLHGQPLTEERLQAILALEGHDDFNERDSDDNSESLGSDSELSSESLGSDNILGGSVAVSGDGGKDGEFVPTATMDV
jgi:hypothetical protein